MDLSITRPLSREGNSRHPAAVGWADAGSPQVDGKSGGGRSRDRAGCARIRAGVLVIRPGWAGPALNGPGAQFSCRTASRGIPDNWLVISHATGKRVVL